MALTATMYRFSVDLSDVDRGVYEQLSFRAAQHPSESVPYLITRVLAYALEYRQGIQFGRGVSTADEPAVSVVDDTGAIELWIDVGVPTADRLHRANKLAGAVAVYTHRDISFLQMQLAGRTIYRASEIRLVPVPSTLLVALEAALDRTNAWSIVRSEGVVYVTVGDASWSATLTEARIA